MFETSRERKARQSNVLNSNQNTNDTSPEAPKPSEGLHVPDFSSFQADYFRASTQTGVRAPTLPINDQSGMTTRATGMAPPATAGAPPAPPPKLLRPKHSYTSPHSPHSSTTQANSGSTPNARRREPPPPPIPRRDALPQSQDPQPTDDDFPAPPPAFQLQQEPVGTPTNARRSWRRSRELTVDDAPDGSLKRSSKRASSRSLDRSRSQERMFSLAPEPGVPISMPVDAAVEQVAKLQVLSDVHRILRDHEHESTLLRSLSGDLHRTGVRTTSRSRERLPLDAAGTPRGSQGSLHRRSSNRRSKNFGSAHSLNGPAGETALARTRQTTTFADKPHGFKMHVRDPTSHGSRDFIDRRGRLGAGSGDDDGGAGGNGDGNGDENNSDTNVRLNANKQHQLKQKADANGANGAGGGGGGAGGVPWLGKYPYGYMAAPAPAPAMVAPGMHVVDVYQRGGRQVVGGYPILYPSYGRPSHQMQSTRHSYRSSRRGGGGRRKRGRYEGVAGISSQRQDLSDTSLTRGSFPRASALKKQLFVLSAVYIILAILSVAAEIFALVTGAWAAAVCFAIWGTALSYLGCGVTAFGAAITLHFHLVVLQKLDRLDRQQLHPDTSTMSGSSNPSQRRRYRRWKLAMFVFLALGALASIVLLILASYGLTADTRNMGNTLASSGNPMLGAHIWKIVVGAAFFVCFGWHVAVTIACSPRYHRHVLDPDSSSVQYSVGGGGAGAPLSDSSMPPPSVSVELPPMSGGRPKTPSSGAPLLSQSQSQPQLQQPLYQPPYQYQPQYQPAAAYVPQQYVPQAATAVPAPAPRPYYATQPAPAPAAGYYPNYQPVQPQQQSLVVNTVPPLVYSTQ